MDLCQNLEVPTEVKFFSSKLLWGQLPSHVIEREILPRPEVVTVCIVRDPIEGFISRTKAMALGRWRDLDTTDFKPTLSADEFEEWANRRKEFNAFIERNESNISLTFSYEELLTRGSMDYRKLGRVLKRTKHFPKLKLSRGHMFPQDREPELSRRVANWDEFERELLTRGNDANQPRGTNKRFWHSLLLNGRGARGSKWIRD
jgi:hypothetical protein